MVLVRWTKELKVLWCQVLYTRHVEYWSSNTILKEVEKKIERERERASRRSHRSKPNLALDAPVNEETNLLETEQKSHSDSASGL